MTDADAECCNNFTKPLSLSSFTAVHFDCWSCRRRRPRLDDWMELIGLLGWFTARLLVLVSGWFILVLIENHF